MNDIVLHTKQACLFYAGGGCSCMPSRACDGCANTISMIGGDTEAKSLPSFREVGESFDDSGLPFAQERLIF